jgi:DNA polymerase-1
MAMIQISGWLQTLAKADKKNHEPKIKMLLQVHDELVFEVEKSFVKEAAAAIKKLMETVVSFEVPLKVDVETGKNWGGLKGV